jgi:hypothetical protein
MVSRILTNSSKEFYLQLIINEEYNSESNSQELNIQEYLENNEELLQYTHAFGDLMIKILANMYTMRMNNLSYYVKHYINSDHVEDPYLTDCIDALRWLCSTINDKKEEVLPEDLLSEALNYRARLVSNMFPKR